VKSPTNILIALLAASVLAVGLLAYSQYRELILLRAQVAANDASALSKKLAAAQKTIRSLEDRLAALRGRGMRDGADTAGGDNADNAAANARGRGGRWGGFAALGNNPEFQKLMAIQAKGRIAQTYGALFKSLNLSPDQLAQFQQLLADKQQAMMDVLQAAREQGINPRTDPDGFKTLMNQAVAQTDQSIQQAIGDAAFQQYQQYQQTLPERNVVNSLQQQLSYTQTPLTDDQANALISLLQQTQPQRAGNGTAGTGDGAGGPGPGIMALVNGGGNARVTDDAIAQAQGVLSAPQVAVLQQVQQQQQAQQQMQQLMRAANQGNGTGSPSQGAPSAPGAQATAGPRG
jgi:hypothetical protein